MLTSKTSIFAKPVLFAVVLVTAVSASAQGNANSVVKERQELMESMGKAMKYMNGVMKGRTQYNAANMQRAADTVNASASQITAHFPNTPESRNNRKSEARDTIWSEWPKFEIIANNLVSASADLKKAAVKDANPQEVIAAFKQVSKQCRSCHRSFKEED